MTSAGKRQSRNARWIITLALLLAVFVALQFFPLKAPGPVLPGDGVLADHVAVPEPVDRLLRSACYDCHSDTTRWPWYSRIAPLSWLIARDVQHGRSNLDFSHWSTDPGREPTPAQRLRWICRDMRKGVMPPALYRLAHPEARLSEEEITLICEWSDRAIDELVSAPHSPVTRVADHPS